MRRIINDHFQPLHEYTLLRQQEIGATAAATYIIQQDTIVNEWYSGRQAGNEGARIVDACTRFNVASVRKTYLALAISMLIEQGLIPSIDDEIGSYLPQYEQLARGVTVRHLLTHTHGLAERDGDLNREFPSAESWAYCNTGIDLLIQLVAKLSGQSLSRYLNEHVFIPYQLHETGWCTDVHDQEHCISNYYDDPDNWVGPYHSDAGDQSNLFISARDLAMWGYIHLRQGHIGGKQLLPRRVFERVAALQTPSTVPAHLPRNGFIWWLQHDTPSNQLGERLPSSSYQVLGITNCVCLVIPELDAVVVRMHNALHNPPGYGYLSDVREFGNLANDLLITNVKP